MYDRILLPTDGSETTTAAIEHAIDAAKRYNAELHVLYVIDEEVYTVYSGDEFVHEFEGAERTLEQAGEKAVNAVQEAAADTDITITTTVGRGVPHEEILAYIDEHDIGLAVLGTHDRPDEYRQLLGSVCLRVAQLTDIPVTIVQASN